MFDNSPVHASRRHSQGAPAGCPPPVAAAAWGEAGVAGFVVGRSAGSAA